MNTFYVGIDPKDELEFKSELYLLNEDCDEKYNTFITGEYDDPHGYYTYILKGTIDSYKCFLRKPYVKSLSIDDDY